MASLKNPGALASASSAKECKGRDQDELRASEGNGLLDTAITEAITRKPKGHDFIIDRRHQRPALSRHMSVTGG